jgi:hypothetical protein
LPWRIQESSEKRYVVTSRSAASLSSRGEMLYTENRLCKVLMQTHQKIEECYLTTKDSDYLEAAAAELGEMGTKDWAPE